MSTQTPPACEHPAIRFVVLCAVLLAPVVVGTPAAGADVTLPALVSTGAGPIIGGGDAAAEQRIMLQLNGRDEPDVPRADGSDAAAFIAAAATDTDSPLAPAFTALRRALGCQPGGAGFGARAYRRADGKWGGATLVIAKSGTPDVEALRSCVQSVWPTPTDNGPASPTSMCAGGWTYPTSGENHRPETYYILLAGTAADFCGPTDANYRNFATIWP